MRLASEQEWRHNPKMSAHTIIISGASFVI